MFNSINSVKIKEDEYCYAMISASEEVILCNVINAKTEKVLLTEPFIEEDAKNFIKKIYFNSKIYKAIIVDAFMHHSRQFCVDLREKLNKLKIPNYFISNENVNFSSALIAANININFEETILIIRPGEKEILCSELKFTPDGYESIRDDVIEVDEEKDPQQIREEIMESSTPKKILALQYSSNVPIKTILKSKKLILFNNSILDYCEKFLIETCKWLFDKSYTKYYILPLYDRDFNACLSYSQIDKEDIKDNEKMILMLSDDPTKLPYTKSEEFEKSFLNCWIDFIDIHEKDEYTKIELERNCHRFKLTMNIDTESFETYNVEQIFLDEIQSLPTNLDTVMKTKIPVIGFFDDSSVVCIHKNGKYQFADNCNGSYGLENFISFDEEKPKYGETALQMMTGKSSFVVFDLLMILSMPVDNIQIFKTWGFTITKDCDNPVLIEFDDFKSGKRTAASPAFLMALLIKKQYLKAIKTEIGEKPSEIGIWVFRDQFNEDEMKRIKKGFEDAFNLIKTKWFFVDC